MTAKMILIILDGLRFDVAQTSMGYLGHLVETNQASFYKVQSELPSLSRPLYEVLLTGTPSSINGITANDMVRLSHQKSVFHLAQGQGLTTAAAAYSWFSELYNCAPFDWLTQREQHDPDLPIQHGIFYWVDSYPDSHLFADAERLRSQHDPDFLLVHPMSIDHTGHLYGSDTPQYRGQAIATDSLLAHFLPRWQAAGYEVLITADHGMNPDGQNGGTSSNVRDIPLFCFSPKIQPSQYLESYLPQRAIAPLVCRLLDIPLGEGMKPIIVPGFDMTA